MQNKIITNNKIFKYYKRERKLSFLIQKIKKKRGEEMKWQNIWIWTV